MQAERAIRAVVDAAGRHPARTSALAIAAVGVLFALLGVTGLWGSLFDVLEPDRISPWWSLVTLVPACVLVAAKDRAPLAALAAGAAVFLLDVTTIGGVGTLLAMLDLLYTAAVTASPRRRRGLLLAILATCAIATGAALAVSGSPAVAALMAIQTLGVLGSSFWWGRSVGQASEVAELHRQRAADAERLAALQRVEAVRDERERMSRELHDVVAGHVAAVAIRAEAALDQHPADAREADALRAIRASSLRAHEALRDMIAVLRTGEEPLIRAPRISEPTPLLEDARAGGLEVAHLDTTRLGEDLPDAVDQTAGLVLRECLANAARHSPGARVDIDVRTTDGGLRLVVRSRDGRHPATDVRGSGMGLALMAERARALGGRLEAGPVSDDEWRVTATLPLAPRRIGAGA